MIDLLTRKGESMKKRGMHVMLVLLVLVLCAGGSLSAQGTAETESLKVVVKAMAYGDNSNQEGLNWVRIVDSFEKANPDIDIDYEMLYDEAYHQKVVARLASGGCPRSCLHGCGCPLGSPLEGSRSAV